MADIFNRIFMNENMILSILISLKFILVVVVVFIDTYRSRLTHESEHTYLNKRR